MIDQLGNNDSLAKADRVIMPETTPKSTIGGHDVVYVEELATKNKRLVRDPDLEELCEKVINDTKMDVAAARISYLLVYPAISKSKFGKVSRLNNEMRLLAKSEYLIEISGDYWDDLTEDQQYMMAEYYLHQILVLFDEKTGENVFKLRKPDVINFSAILEKYDMNDFENVKLIMSSVADMSPAQTDEITL